MGDTAQKAVSTVEEKKNDPLALVKALTDSMPDDKKSSMMRNVWLTLENKTLTVKNEENKNVQVKYTPAQALAYVMACDDLGLNPIMSHVIMLENQFYITLQGHLQNAHATGQLLGMDTLRSSPTRT
jgi:hypothetical protein